MEEFNKNSKPVQQIDKDTGVVMNQFPSIVQAKKYTGIGNIGLGISRNYIVGGFRWKLLGKYKLGWTK